VVHIWSFQKNIMAEGRTDAKVVVVSVMTALVGMKGYYFGDNETSER